MGEQGAALQAGSQASETEKNLMQAQAAKKQAITSAIAGVAGAALGGPIGAGMAGKMCGGGAVGASMPNTPTYSMGGANATRYGLNPYWQPGGAYPGGI